MSQVTDDAGAPRARMSPGKGLLVLLGVVVGVAAYIAIGGALGLEALFAGFVFAFYWSGILHADVHALPASLIGGLAGLFTAYLMHTLPGTMGTPGLVIALGVILLAIYCLIMGWVPIVVNNAYMLFLTVGTIPGVAAQNDFLGMACAILLIAALLGGLLVVVGAITKSRAQRQVA